MLQHWPRIVLVCKVLLAIAAGLIRLVVVGIMMSFGVEGVVLVIGGVRVLVVACARQIVYGLLCSGQHYHHRRNHQITPTAVCMCRESAGVNLPPAAMPGPMGGISE